MLYMSRLMTKPTKWLCAERRLRSAFTVRSRPKLSLWGQRRLWSEWAHAQADLSLRWAHRSFLWFCHEAAHFLLIMHKPHWDIHKYIIILYIRITQLSSPTNGGRFEGSTTGYQHRVLYEAVSQDGLKAFCQFDVTVKGVFDCRYTQTLKLKMYTVNLFYFCYFSILLFLIMPSNSYFLIYRSLGIIIIMSLFNEGFTQLVHKTNLPWGPL